MTGTRSILPRTLALSAAAHLALLLVAAVGGAFSPLDGADARVYELELLSRGEAPRDPRDRPRDEQWLLPPPRARLGDRSPLALARAADTLNRTDQQGALAGEGRARPSPDPTVGDDLDRLRTPALNHLSRDSESRIKTRRYSVTYDNDRQTPNPSRHAELTSGRGTSPLRVRDNARSGQRREVQPPNPPSRAAASPVPLAGDEERFYDDEPGMAAHSRTPRGGAAPTATRRPALDRAPPTTLSGERRYDLADDTVRELASTRRVSDLLDAARPDDRGTGSGRGAGARAGRRGSPTGEPRGVEVWIMSADQRYIGYLKRVHRKIQPLWSFPKELQLMMEQGDVLVRFTVHADGRVSDVKVKKPSGFPKFDQIVVAAIRRAAPFAPIPPRLGSKLHILAPFEFSNPMVR